MDYIIYQLNHNIGDNNSEIQSMLKNMHSLRRSRVDLTQSPHKSSKNSLQGAQFRQTSPIFSPALQNIEPNRYTPQIVSPSECNPSAHIQQQIFNAISYKLSSIETASQNHQNDPEYHEISFEVNQYNSANNKIQIQQRSQTELHQLIQNCQQKIERYEQIMLRNYLRFTKQKEEMLERHEKMYDMFIYLIQKQKQKNQKLTLQYLKLDHTKHQNSQAMRRKAETLNIHGNEEEQGRFTATFNYNF